VIHWKVNVSGSARGGTCISQAPTMYVTKNTGGMVSGLVSHTRLTAIGRLPRNGMANAAASSICAGIGIKAANRPTPMARATE